MKNLKVGEELVIKIGRSGTECSVEKGGKIVNEVFRVTLDVDYKPELSIWGYDTDEQGSIITYMSEDDGLGNATEMGVKKVLRRFNVEGELKLKLLAEGSLNDDGWLEYRSFPKRHYEKTTRSEVNEED